MPLRAAVQADAVRSSDSEDLLSPSRYSSPRQQLRQVELSNRVQVQVQVQNPSRPRQSRVPDQIERAKEAALVDEAEKAAEEEEEVLDEQQVGIEQKKGVFAVVGKREGREAGKEADN